MPEVREALREADLVVPSLDAGDAPTFEAVNRPHSGLAFGQMVGGLLAFGQEFRGAIWLEVFLVAGLNAAPAQVQAMAELCDRLQPDKVQLNTVTRPPAERAAAAVGADLLQECAQVFRVPVEVIADHPAATQTPRQEADEEALAAMLQRRPCTVHDVAAALGLHPNDVLKHLEHLLRQNRVTRIPAAGGEYYVATPRSPWR